jgi:hypothetical protein
METSGTHSPSTYRQVAHEVWIPTSKLGEIPVARPRLCAKSYVLEKAIERLLTEIVQVVAVPTVFAPVFEVPSLDPSEWKASDQQVLDVPHVAYVWDRDDGAAATPTDSGNLVDRTEKVNDVLEHGASDHDVETGLLEGQRLIRLPDQETRLPLEFWMSLCKHVVGSLNAYVR